MREDYRESETGRLMLALYLAHSCDDDVLSTFTHNKRSSEPVSKVGIGRVVFRRQVVRMRTPSAERVGQRRDHEGERWWLVED